MSFEQIMASDWSKVEQDKSTVFTSFHIHPSHQGQSSNGICYALNSSLFKRLSNTPPPPLSRSAVLGTRKFILMRALLS